MTTLPADVNPNLKKLSDHMPFSRKVVTPAIDIRGNSAKSFQKVFFDTFFVMSEKITLSEWFRGRRFRNRELVNNRFRLRQLIPEYLWNWCSLKLFSNLFLC